MDVATLTAAMKLALGHRTFGVLSDNDAFHGRVLDAAVRTPARLAEDAAAGLGMAPPAA